jgi:hypothetical protein
MEPRGSLPCSSEPSIRVCILGNFLHVVTLCLLRFISVARQWLGWCHFSAVNSYLGDAWFSDKCFLLIEITNMMVMMQPFTVCFTAFCSCKSVFQKWYIQFIKLYNYWFIIFVYMCKHFKDILGTVIDLSVPWKFFWTVIFKHMTVLLPAQGLQENSSLHFDYVDWFPRSISQTEFLLFFHEVLKPG